MQSRSALLALAALAAVACVLVATSAAVAQRQAVASWWDRAPQRWSEHYLIKTDLPLADARAIGRHLDRMYEEFSTRLAALPPRTPEKLNVYLFLRQGEYIRTLRTRWGIDGTGTGGMFFVRPEGSGLALWTEDLPTRRVHHVIQHEGFHQFAYSRFGDDLPQWVNEGLAEFFGHSVLVGDRLILGLSTPRTVDSVKQAIERDRHIPFRQMLVTTNRQWNEQVAAGNASLQYEQSWSMVHFLVYDRDRRWQPHFERYLRLLNSGKPSDAAFSEVFGDDVGPFEEKWKAYALAAEPSAFMAAVDRIEFLAEGALELSRRGEVPATMTDLKEALRAIKFTHAVTGHGQTVELSADDDENFEIPGGAASFVISKANVLRLTRRERALEKEQPTPTQIRTEGLKPRGLSVRWVRDRKTKKFRYQIDIR